jgi:LysR family transcriptional regulator, benzoate and cis,cis-muconate-responsive activator of ben and cat genes
MVMELRHLRYFVTVATELSFSRAAEKLRIAQPPLSRQIQQLEDELGTQLLHRSRPITLTEAGRYLFEQAVQMLRKSDELQTMTKRIGSGKKQQFGIGFVASTLYDTLPELIREFRSSAPDVEIILTELITIEQAIALKEGRIDIGFGRLWFDDDGLTRRVLREEKLAVAVPRGHHLSRITRRLMLKQIVDAPLILYPNAPRPSYADQVLSFYRKRGIEPKVGFEVHELQTALGLVAAGLGISIVPLSVRRLGREDVDYLSLEEPDITSPIIVSYRSNDGSALLARMISLIGEFDPKSSASARQRKS